MIFKMGLYYNPMTDTARAFSQSPAPVPEGFHFVDVIEVGSVGARWVANPWKAAVLDELTTVWALRPEHEADPRTAIKDAIEANVKIALDPEISEAAVALIAPYKKALWQACGDALTAYSYLRPHLAQTGRAV